MICAAFCNAIFKTLSLTFHQIRIRFFKLPVFLVVLIRITKFCCLRFLCLLIPPSLTLCSNLMYNKYPCKFLPQCEKQCPYPLFYFIQPFFSFNYPLPCFYRRPPSPQSFLWPYNQISMILYKHCISSSLQTISRLLRPAAVIAPHINRKDSLFGCLLFYLSFVLVECHLTNSN